MPVDVTEVLKLRKEELRRRIESLPYEVKTWADRTRTVVDENLHFSQVASISVLMDAFHRKQSDLLASMDPTKPGGPFETACRETTMAIVASQRAWDYFRSKLDLRLLPQFAPTLRTADIIAYDCYAPVMGRAKNAGLVSDAAMREPPLTYLSPEFSPLTWVRGKRPNDGRDYELGEAALPIPVIELPLDHLKNAWELLSIHHEVGHDLEADLKLRPALKASLEKSLEASDATIVRKKHWRSWLAEIVADLVALQLAGPAYADMLLNFLLMPAIEVTTISSGDPHPNHYLRIRFLAACIRTMAGKLPSVSAEVSAHANAVEERWLALYGEPPELVEFVPDFEMIIAAVADTAFAELGAKSLREFIPFTFGDQRIIKEAINFLLTGVGQPPNISPRLVVSAARLAVTTAGADLDAIDQRTNEWVAKRAPLGLLATLPHARADAVRQFVKNFDFEKTLVPDFRHERNDLVV